MITICDFQKKKASGEKITMVTCYDYTSAAILNGTGVDCLLVGDRLAMTMHGFRDTLGAWVEMMALHTAPVARGAKKKFIVGDLPFLSYRSGLNENMAAVRTLMQAGGHAGQLGGGPGDAAVFAHPRYFRV